MSLLGDTKWISGGSDKTLMGDILAIKSQEKQAELCEMKDREIEKKEFLVISENMFQLKNAEKKK